MDESELPFNEDSVLRKLNELMEQMVEACDRFNLVSDRQIREGRLTLEESSTFLSYYRVQVGVYSLLEALPHLLDSDEDFRRLTLRARRNVSYMEQVLSFYMTGMEPEEWLD